MKLIAPSILSADFSNLAEQIKLLETAGTKLIHCDIMDGQFVPNITFGPLILSAIRKITNIPLDIHLMIKNPDNLIKDFVIAGADYISVHYEEVVHLDRTINVIKDFGIKAGVVINPSTPVNLLTDIIHIVDFVLIMSVNPGFGGQKFIPYCLNKIKECSILRDKFKLNFLIEVDGGITIDNLKDVLEAGTDIAVVGNSIFKSENITTALQKFNNIVTNF